MPSPLLHAASGAAILVLERRTWETRRWRTATLVLAAALLPDFDFVIGLLLRDPNRFHAEFTHTLGFSLLVAAVFGFAAGRHRLRAAVLCLAAAFSHDLLDALTSDTREPLGVSLFWPLRDARFSFPLLPGVRHGFDHATVTEFLRAVFSLANLRTLGIEFLAGALLIAGAWALGAAWRRVRPPRGRREAEKESGLSRARPR